MRAMLLAATAACAVCASANGGQDPDLWAMDMPEVPTQMLVPKQEEKTVRITRYEILALEYDMRTGDVRVVARGTDKERTVEVMIQPFVLTRATIEADLAGEPTELVSVKQYFETVKRLAAPLLLDAVKKGRISIKSY